MANRTFLKVVFRRVLSAFDRSLSELEQRANSIEGQVGECHIMLVEVLKKLDEMKADQSQAVGNLRERVLNLEQEFRRRAVGR